MTSNETTVIKPLVLDEHLSRLKPIDEQRGLADKQILQVQPKLHSSSLFPPIARAAPPKSMVTSRNMESLASSIVGGLIGREGFLRSVSRNNTSSITSGSPRLQTGINTRPKRTSLYDHVGPKINTGLAIRTESLTRAETDSHRLGPIRPINWRLLKQELERDLEIRAQTKRLQFNSGIIYAQQLATLGDLVRTKVKSHVAATMNYIEERYKIVVHLTVFQTSTAALHVVSRCLWNSYTDNSITIKMHGIDCDILIVVFLCYTELGSV
ncbi:unnamed protein product [Adineta ricciae]|uniref:Uncharacterized protein n=1 Tax=Adineta ricciae TaxID=249248 RepID=A0A814UWD1_ADIRI|nr:unnamed protein product [Adineta ricciae]CAF1183095.1 unnamed protein product [Adineta ricciae]